MKYKYFKIRIKKVIKREYKYRSKSEQYGLFI